MPVAIGALPFLPFEPARLIVPQVLAVGRPGRLLAVVAGGVPPADAVRQLSEGALGADRSATGSTLSPDEFVLRSSRSHDDFIDRVEQAVAEVRSGRLDKVVLAREVVVEANKPFSQAELLERLRSLYPSCVTFHVEGFVGASPELLVSRRGAEVCSEPLAGTIARSGDADTDKRTARALSASAKERAEHSLVVEAIAASLSPLVASLKVSPEPEIVELRNVSHLRSRLEGVLEERDGRLPSALDLAASLHPTPAVAGSPVEEAVEYLVKAEDLDRGPYAGPVGWMRSDGDGEFHLGIRSAMVNGATARLYAGAGIVSDSDPHSELRETQLKLQAMLAAAVRP
jgi:menaquinone-specific isochorismate synthase